MGATIVLILGYPLEVMSACIRGGKVTSLTQNSSIFLVRQYRIFKEILLANGWAGLYFGFTTYMVHEVINYCGSILLDSEIFSNPLENHLRKVKPSLQKYYKWGILLCKIFCLSLLTTPLKTLMWQAQAAATEPAVTPSLGLLASIKTIGWSGLYSGFIPDILYGFGKHLMLGFAG
jgi:hypothetical protein